MLSVSSSGSSDFFCFVKYGIDWLLNPLMLHIFRLTGCFWVTPN